MALFRRIRRFTTAAGYLLFAASVVLVSAPAFADSVNIATSQQPGAGRITFSWRSPVPFVASQQGRQITIQFGRPIDNGVGALPGALTRYIGRPTLSNGNRTLVLPLQGSFDLNYFPQGNQVIVEIVDLPDSPKAEPKAESKAAPKAEPKAEPKAAAKAEPKAPPPAASPAATPSTPTVTTPAPAGAERVGVRVGEHDTFLRIVFDWDKDVGAKIEHPGNRAVITFDRPANIAIAPLQRGDAKNVAGASTGVVGNSTVVTLNVPTTSKIDTSRSGPKVVIDVHNPTGANDAAAPPTVPTAPVAATAPPTAPSPPPSPQSAATPPPAPASPSAPQATTELKAPPKGTPPAAAAPPLQKGLPPPAAAPAPPSSPVGPPAVAAVSGSADTPSWRIDWSDPVGAAVFRRGGALWIVFDQARQIDAAAATNALRGISQGVSQVPTQRGTFIRIVSAPDINPTIRRDGFAWIFDFKKQPLLPASPIEPKPEFNTPTDPHVVVAVTQPGEALPVTDPGVGDNLVVVPVIPLAYGVTRTYSYPQFDVLPSAQGVVVHPKADDVRVRSIQRGVDLSGAAGPLALSPPNPAAEAAQRIGAFRQVSRIFTIDSWRFARRVTDVTDFNKTAADLLDKVADAQEGQSKQKARLDYAQFLMGSGWGYEAMGVLDTIASIDPAMQSNAEYRLLRGATEWLIDRLEEAEKSLSYEGLNDNDEGEFWRAIVAASVGKRKEAAPILKDKGNVFRSYPRALKIKTGIEIVDAAVEIGDINMANSYLQVLAEEKPEGKEIDQLALREGAVDELSGNFDGAVAAWEAVQKGTDLPSIAEATVRRANLLLQRKQIEPKEAIAELEKLRFAWRGGLFEFKLLHRLGQLYMSVGDYRNGLRTLQEAVTYFRGEPETNAVADEMAKTFVDLYLNDQADQMPPVQAIALYDEFKELTPPGEKGDEMIRKLADRLASVDLLDRAAQILEDQVNFRLKGLEKARVGARLATVYLLNRQPGAAVSALEKSRVDGMPADLDANRRHLQARGLMDAGRTQEAERILDRDESPEADELRAEVYWGKQDWADAAKSLQKIVQRAGVKPNDPLDEQQAQKVLNFATAVALSGNERGIVKIGQDYGTAMNASPFKDAFNLIASPNANGLIDYRSVGDKVKTAANFTSFMDAYKKRLKEGKLSSLY